MRCGSIQASAARPSRENPRCIRDDKSIILFLVGDDARNSIDICDVCKMNTIPILMYHNISPLPQGGLLPWLYVTPRAFAAHIKLLHWLGFQGLSMGSAMPYLRGEKHGRIVVITFDDGYVDTFKQALPVLKAYGFSATCYAVSTLIGGYNVWDAEQINARKPLMDASQLRAWQDAGMEVGSHSCTHPRLTACSDEQLVVEVTESKLQLEEMLRRPITQFSYPYGDFDQRVKEAVRRAGYTSAVTVRRGRTRRSDDLLQLHRVTISNYHRRPHLAFKVLTRFEDRRA